MSALHRFLSASAASWAKILLTVATQVLLVPLFLSHWSVEEYGCWLIVQTIMGIGSLMSNGFQTYTGYEFLKITGDRKPQESRQLFYSTLPCALGVAAFELLVQLGVIYFGLMRNLFDGGDALDPTLLHQADVSVVLYSVCYLIASSAGGLAGRAVAPLRLLSPDDLVGRLLSLSPSYSPPRSRSPWEPTSSRRSSGST